MPNLVKTWKRIKQDNRIIDQLRIPSLALTLINTTCKWKNKLTMLKYQKNIKINTPNNKRQIVGYRKKYLC